MNKTTRLSWFKECHTFYFKVCHKSDRKLSEYLKFMWYTIGDYKIIKKRRNESQNKR